MQHEFSFAALILNADPIVQTVMALLVLASVACWAIVFEKLGKFRRLRKAAAAFEAAVKADALVAGDKQHDDIQGHILAAAAREKREGFEPGETRTEFRSRLEAAMRQAMAQQLRRVEPGLPFVGLFGTVWGIMNSFTAIAGSNDTSLAVVAPGIAEALFATALGLVAAIPAVIAYNKLSTDLGRLAQRFNAAITEAARQFARGTMHAARSHADAGQ
jgi:biopolymer transport protein TolQ